MRAKLFVEPPQSAQAGTAQVAQASTTNNNNTSSSVSTNTTGANSTSQVSANNTATNSSLATPAAAATLNILQGASIQGNPAYSPDQLTVKKGDTIQVTNKDSVLHTVTNGKGADDPNAGKLFDTSIINAGQSAQIATTKLTSGQQYPFHCSVHPYMTGVLKVQ